MDIISKKRIKENRYDKNGRNHLCCGTNKPVILKNLERIYKVLDCAPNDVFSFDDKYIEYFRRDGEYGQI